MVLGGHLRRYRKGRGISLKDAGRHIGASESKISRLETGQHEFKAGDIGRLLDVYGVVPAQQRYLMGLLEHANKRPWWQDWSDVATKQLQAFVSFEEMAQRIRTYEPTQLPGLLQTEEYARAVIEAGEEVSSPHEVERLVGLRLQRRKRFEDEPTTGKRLIAVIDEVTLMRPFGNKGVMQRQLDHLITLTEHPRHTMRIAELRRPNLPVMLGMTVIFDFENRLLPDIVYTEQFDGAFILQEEKQVDGRIKAFDRLQNASLSHQRSAQRLRDLREKL
ncbi:helix-turn-helix domain-containing protein [Streptomyces lushanensis]|uniref:helix-turn-helix domain-containing protein n=1 Tax=Streptomyces lushanensis TaxID=1434255 RepID=UPI0008326D29|nr:helix-turn-helix transcriptional regulator [Streptomyces lushanensis]